LGLPADLPMARRARSQYARSSPTGFKGDWSLTPSFDKDSAARDGSRWKTRVLGWTLFVTPGVSVELEVSRDACVLFKAAGVLGATLTTLLLLSFALARRMMSCRSSSSSSSSSSVVSPSAFQMLARCYGQRKNQGSSVHSDSLESLSASLSSMNDSSV
jgi:hypothetical protein